MHVSLRVLRPHGRCTLSRGLMWSDNQDQILSVEHVGLLDKTRSICPTFLHPLHAGGTVQFDFLASLPPSGLCSRLSKGGQFSLLTTPIFRRFPISHA